MAHSLTTIGLHFEWAIQAEMVVELELALIERKQSHRFRQKSIICKKLQKGSKVCQRQRSCRAKRGRVSCRISPFGGELKDFGGGVA